jgi:hypothetical protein
MAERAAALGVDVVRLKGDRIAALPDVHADAKSTLALVVVPLSWRRPQPIAPIGVSISRPAARHRAAWVGGLDAVIALRVWDHVIRLYSGCPGASIRFSTPAVMAPSVAWRLPLCGRSPAPRTRFRLETPASTRACQVSPDACCQPMRPRSATRRRGRSCCVGAVSAAAPGPSP